MTDDVAVPFRSARRMGRRSFLVAAGAVAIAACSSDADDPSAAASADATVPPAPPPEATGVPARDADEPAEEEPPFEEDGPEALPPLTAAQFAALPTCAVLPSTTAGPFPTVEQLDRRDITEGHPGHPLRLGIRVVDDACQPVPGAQVEIWHTDATGDYSSYEDNGSGKDEGAGSTFLRGYQTADADGILEFQTIYPGWYEGRAIHIHVRARVDDSTVLTSQIYFDEAYTETVLASGPYAEFGPPDTTWATDRISGDPLADGSAVAVSPAPTALGTGTLGLINLGVSI